MRRSRLDQWIAQMLSDTPLRTSSLVITLYGDGIEPHGGTVWLGSLIDLAAPLGINDRAIRTSVFRLTQEEWLRATQIGRRSTYSLTESGRRRIKHAYRRIYDTPHEAWNGEWQIVILPERELSPSDREALRRDLIWDGYGAIAPGVFAHPSADTARLNEVLLQTNNSNRVVLLNATTLDGITSAPLWSLVHQCWRLDRLAEDYQRFVERFRPALKWLKDGKVNDPEQCFVLRTLLIHEFRRVQLRDPQLPEVLLSPQWPGHEARQLCRDLYDSTLLLSEQHLMDTLATPDGRLPPADDGLYKRFGGLTQAV